MPSGHKAFLVSNSTAQQPRAHARTQLTMRSRRRRPPPHAQHHFRRRVRLPAPAPSLARPVLTLHQDRTLRFRTKAHRDRRARQAAGRQGDQRQGPRQDGVVDGRTRGVSTWVVWAYKASL